MRKENLKLGIHGPQFEIELRVRELTLCKPNEGKNSISLKRSFREIEEEGAKTDYNKKEKRGGI